MIHSQWQHVECTHGRRYQKRKQELGAINKSRSPFSVKCRQGPSKSYTRHHPLLLPPSTRNGPSPCIIPRRRFFRCSHITAVRMRRLWPRSSWGRAISNHRHILLRGRRIRCGIRVVCRGVVLQRRYRAGSIPVATDSILPFITPVSLLRSVLAVRLRRRLRDCG